MKERWNHIDLLESIAIYFVLVYHTTLYNYDFLNDGSFSTYFAYFFRTMLSTCVPLFFFANGYLLFNKPFVLKKHVKKTIRLVLLVFIWALILMPIYLLIAGEPVSLKTIINSILVLDIRWGMNVFWYLGALVCIYVFFPAMKALFDTNRKAFLIFTIAIVFFTIGDELISELVKIASVVLNHHFGSTHKDIFIMFNPLRGLRGYSFAYFCVGGLAHKYEEMILNTPQLKRNVLAVIGIIASSSLLFASGLFYSFNYDPEWDVVWDGYGTIFTFFNVLFIYILTLNYTNSNRFITTISKNTLGIYLIQYLVINPTHKLITPVKWLCNIPINLLYAFLVLCCCTVICIMLRRIPFIRNLI